MGVVISMRPSDFGKGGFLDDVDVRITDAKFVMYNYEGKSERGDQPTLAIEMAPLPLVENEAPRIQYYSCGDATKFAPSEDGKTLVAVGAASQLNENCNAAKFLTALVKCGFQEDKLGNDIGVLVGTEGHVKAVAQEDTGFRNQVRDPKKGPRTVVLFVKLAKAGYEKAAGGTASKTTPATPATGGGNGEPSADIRAKAVAAILTVIKNAGGTVALREVGKSVFPLVKNDKAKAEILKLAVDQAWLGDLLADGVAFDKDAATLTAL